MKDIIGITTKRVATTISASVNQYVMYEGLDRSKLYYAVEIMVSNISKLIILAIVASLMSILFEVLVVFVSFKLVRKYACGIHAKSSTACLISSMVLLLLVTKWFAVMGFQLDRLEALAAGLIMAILLWMYAPADTKKYPLVGKDLLKYMRHKTFATACTLSFLLYILPYDDIRLNVVYGIFIEVVTILPITYQVFNRRRNNYEIYENKYE